MPKKSPTIKDVAARAGVSVMAVSRVCNADSGGRVSAAMREKVMEAITALGYHPDTLARSLRRRRLDTVGFYNGYRGLIVLDDGFSRSIFAGLQDASTELGQDLLVFHVPEDTVPVEDITHQLSTTRVDGVIFLPQSGDESLARMLGESYQNVVGIVEAVSGIPVITAQDALGSRKIVEHLFERGHRHVMYRRALGDLISCERRHEAFLKHAAVLGMQVTTTRTTLENDDLDAEEREILGNVAHNGITAIATWRDLSAVRALLYCRESGLRVPQDMAIAGFDKLTPQYFPPGYTLTTIEVDWAEVARRAVAYVVKGREAAVDGLRDDQIFDQDGRYEIAIDCDLVAGNTT